MPEEKNPAEAVKAAAEAVEALAENKKGESPADHKMRSLAAVILACASLIGTIGSLYKSCDHSVTENAYATLTTGIQKNTEAEQQNHQDIVAIRGYLDGLARAPMTMPPAPAMDAGAPAIAPSTPTPAPTLTPLVRPKPVTAAAVPRLIVGDAGSPVALLVESQTLPPPPEVHPPPAPWKAKPWADVAALK